MQIRCLYIRNIINNKTYIGSSNNFRRSQRFCQYYNINYLIQADGMYINRALKKYGYGSFNVEILEYYDPYRPAKLAIF
jgi:group I intron endonuclease